MRSWFKQYTPPQYAADTALVLCTYASTEVNGAIEMVGVSVNCGIGSGLCVGE
jgi:hypothetical protein